MEINNPKYQKQGIHLISSIFTIDKGIIKVLLIKRKNEPFKNYWALVGGALYNDEELLDGLNREIKLKTGINNIELKLCSVVDEIKTTKNFRMIAISYVGLIDSKKVNILKQTTKTFNSDWFTLNQIPILAYEHNKILDESVNFLKSNLLKSNILKVFYPDGFTIPELQKLIEDILNKKLDRRNFRKKIIGFDYIYDTNLYKNIDGKKPAKIYKFKDNIDDDKNVF